METNNKPGYSYGGSCVVIRVSSEADHENLLRALSAAARAAVLALLDKSGAMPEGAADYLPMIFDILDAAIPTERHLRHGTAGAGLVDAKAS